MLPARMRCGAGWSDACILNVSSGGLLVYSLAPAQPGSTIELRRGDQLVIARVIWRQSHRIGLCSQGPLSVDELISDATAAAAVPAIAGGMRFERRGPAREPDRSRHQSRTIEFISVVLGGVLLASLAGTMVYETLAAPVSAVTQALSID